LGRTHHGVIQAIGVKVFDSLADALFVVSGGDDLQVFPQAQGFLDLRAIGFLHHDLEVVDHSLLIAADHQLVAPTAPVFRHCRPDRIVTPLITTDRLECRGDRLHFVFDAVKLRDHLAEAQTLRGRIVLGKQQAEDLRLAECTHAQRGGNRAVDAAGDGDDYASFARLACKVAQTARDLLDFGVFIEGEDYVVQDVFHGRGHWRELRTKCSSINIVDSMPTNAMLSANPMARPARHFS
jgi:hypothetical protein